MLTSLPETLLSKLFLMFFIDQMINFVAKRIAKKKITIQSPYDFWLYNDSNK